MAKVVDLNIDPDVKDLMLKGVNVKDRGSIINIEKKEALYNNRNLKVIQDRSLIDQISTLWNALNSAEKTAWENAGACCGLSGYNLFVTDTSYRIKNSLAGVATPNTDYQFKVLKVNAPDVWSHVSFIQFHGSSYFVRQYRPGSKNAYDWNEIEEEFTPPFKLEFDYFSDLTVAEWSSFTVYAYFEGLKSGVPSNDYADFNLDAITDWQRFSEEIEPDLDLVDYYLVQIYSFSCNGIAYFDNFNMEYNGQNWAFDPSCNNVKAYDLIDDDDVKVGFWDTSSVWSPASVSSFYLE